MTTTIEMPVATDLRVLNSEFGMYPYSIDGLWRSRDYLEAIVEPHITDEKTSIILTFQERDVFLADDAPALARTAAEALQYLYPLINMMVDGEEDCDQVAVLAYWFGRREKEVEFQEIFRRESIDCGITADKHSRSQAQRARERSLFSEEQWGLVEEFIAERKNVDGIAGACRKAATQLRLGEFRGLVDTTIDIDEETVRRQWYKARKKK